MWQGPIPPDYCCSCCCPPCCSCCPAAATSALAATAICRAVPAGLDTCGNLLAR